jgi:hypothetical protein
MDAIILAIIVVVAIAGPSVLALVLYRRLNPNHRVRWRDADRELPHRDWRPGLFYMGRGGDSGGGSGGDSGGDSGGSG